ncbi:MAG: M23 family metallopeptidase [Acidobacteria bacterium]|nr:M23 family metallopeptidase [Acidobacteriota bacterium]
MPGFLSHRYTVVVVDRVSGVGRRFSVRLGWTLGTVGFLFALPVLVGLGIRWSTVAELSALRSNTVALEMENASYRTATGELTTQLTSLQGVIDELGTRSALDPEVARAMQKLPTMIKARAMGGGTTAASSSLLASALSSPEDTFGLLRNVLGRLESQLRVVRTDVDRRVALAAATPSIWPTVGWLSAGYGERADPLTGDPGYHQGLDISTDPGKPIVATADGVVESASWSGNYGNLLVIDHGFGIKTRYGHLAAFAASVGATVRRGEVVGYVGATGRTTGPHLHYEVMTNGQAINPLQLLVSPR